jgi:predicted TIM-barrel fold metal-dependent hydrolase
VIDALGASQVLFETDFPHPTCLYPDPLTAVEPALHDFDDDVKRRVLQDNAAELYKVSLPVTA